MEAYESQPVSPLDSRRAWILIISFCLLLLISIIAGVNRLSVLFFPLGSIYLGLLLYWRYPHLYVGFVWWLWFVGPLLRRLIDFRSGGLTPGHFMLTPTLVTWISVITLFRYFPRLYDRQALPFALCAGSIFYGFVVGVIEGNPLNSNTYGTLQMLGPIFFGFHLFIHSDDYPTYRKITLSVFLWGVIFMGLYGLIQRLILPGWDQAFLFNIAKDSQIIEGVNSGFGLFSTTEGRQQFAGFMMAGLLLLLCQGGRLLTFVGAGLGTLTFLLSRARAGWLSWGISMVAFIPSLKPRFQIRIISLVFILAVLVIPLTFLEPFSTFINDRIGSLSSLEDDVSLSTRGAAYNLLFAQAVVEVVGKGIGFELSRLTKISAFDGAILPMLFWLGWVGVLVFVSGILLVLWKMFSARSLRADPFASASRAITVGILAQIGFNLIFIASLAMVFWGFVGMTLAAGTYHERQQKDPRLWQASL